MQSSQTSGAHLVYPVRVSQASLVIRTNRLVAHAVSGRFLPGGAGPRNLWSQQVAEMILIIEVVWDTCPGRQCFQWQSLWFDCNRLVHGLEGTPEWDRVLWAQEVRRIVGGNKVRTNAGT